MASSTITVKNLIDYASTHTKLAPIIGVGGVQLEPGMSIANNVLQKLLGKPFNWKFNRTALGTAITLVDNTQTYSQSLTNVGWLERSYIEFDSSTATPKPKHRIECVQNIETSDQISQHPLITKVCVDSEASTTTTFKVWPIPRVPSGQTWKLYIDYQKKPTLLDQLSDTFSPVPDEYGDVLRQLFLAFTYRLVDDRKYEREMALAEGMIYERMGSNTSETETGITFHPDRGLLLG